MKFPVQPIELALYLEHLARLTESKAAVEEAANAIAWVHEIAGLPSPTSHAAVQAIMEGVRCRYTEAKKKKDPVRRMKLLSSDGQVLDLSHCHCLLRYLEKQSATWTQGSRFVYK